MDHAFDPYRRRFASLSVADLLEARDAFHVHLSHLAIVCGTAIGLYLIRDGDHDAAAPTDAADARRERGHRGERTLANASAKPWSWPCVLVFVDQWLTVEQARQAHGASVPPFVYLPDGRVVPVCTVLAPPGTGPSAPAERSPYAFTSHALAPGYPLLTRVQGEARFGTAGCLVTDGRRTCVATSAHVAGAPGEPVGAVVQDEPVQIGVAGARSIGAIEFPRLYPTLPARQTWSTLDVGLVDLHDASAWTAQAYGLGPLGPMATFDADTASLDWIGRDVLAHGAASGRLEGRIHALFYRWRSTAGRDAVTDFLIGARGAAPLATRPGDSGALWCIDPAEYGHVHGRGAPAPRFRPFALQWGGARMAAAGDPTLRFALASSLAVICRELEVDLVTDVRDELPQYWGATGHYKIAQLAVEAVRDRALAAFLRDNLSSISFDEAAIAAAIGAQDPTRFVPLADVPDYVWKTSINKTNRAAARAQENWTHYADLDLPGADGRTLDALCGTPPLLDLAAWIRFYRGASPPSADASRTLEMGSLPFRVWQVFDEMLAARRAGKADRFLAACGILAHYVGDACQPLHGSMHSDGLDGARTGVHVQYEDRMIDRHAPQLRTALDGFDDARLAPLGATAADGGHAAARICVELMRRARGYLSPQRICRSFERHGGGRGQATVDGLWRDLGEDTTRCLADGRRVLAALWDGAWAAVPGHAFTGIVAKPALRRLYESPEFLPSRHLANLDPARYPVPAAR